MALYNELEWRHLRRLLFLVAVLPFGLVYDVLYVMVVVARVCWTAATPCVIAIASQTNLRDARERIGNLRDWIFVCASQSLDIISDARDCGKVSVGCTYTPSTPRTWIRNLHVTRIGYEP